MVNVNVLLGIPLLIWPGPRSRNSLYCCILQRYKGHVNLLLLHYSGLFREINLLCHFCESFHLILRWRFLTVYISTKKKFKNVGYATSDWMETGFSFNQYT